MDLTQYLKTCARARRVDAEGADVMVMMQSRGGARRSERFQICCLKSAVRLERRDEEVERLLLDRYGPDGERYRARHPEMQICSWFLRRNSSERLGAAIFKIRVDALADSVRTEHRPVRFGRLQSCHRGCGGCVRTGNPRLIESTLLQLSCPLEVPIGHERQLCLVLAI